MTKTELASGIASASGLTQVQSSQVLNATIEEIREALARGEEVNIAGFGTFKITKREERMGRNPKTGETIKINAANSPRFVPAKALKEAVNR